MTAFQTVLRPPRLVTLKPPLKSKSGVAAVRYPLISPRPVLAGGPVRLNLQLWLDFQNPLCFDGDPATQLINDLSLNGYQWHRGQDASATASDPTFVPGPPANFLYDGGDIIRHTNAYSGSIFRTAGQKNVSFTLEAWINRGPVANTDEVLFGNGTSGAANNIFIYSDYTGNVPRITVSPSGSSLDFGTQVPPGVWQHIVYVVTPDNSTPCLLYQNGVLTGSGVLNGTWTSGDSENTASLGANAALTVPFQNGSRLAIARMYDRRLTEDEVWRNYNAELSRFVS